MTQDAIARDGEPFWMRVKTALAAIRPDRERLSAYGQTNIARSLGIRPRLGARIDEELARGWAAAAAKRVSLSLLVIEIDRMAEYFNAYGREAVDDCVLAVTEVIKKHLPREADTCLRLGRAGFVLVLPDLPALMARSIAGKIAEAVKTLSIAHKESHAGIVTVSAGLAVCNPQGEYERSFYETAAQALKRGQRKGLARLEAVDLRPAQDRQRKAA
jgi:diguanylate cyclase (GGDEF)-like protein